MKTLKRFAPVFRRMTRPTTHAMGRRLTALALCGALAATAPLALAQRATERFIPLGQSPGVSGKTAMMGTVVGYANGMLTLSSPAYPAPQRVRVSAATEMWLDRTAMRQSNVTASTADLVAGRRIEIRFVDPATRQVAAWIKIQAGG